MELLNRKTIEQPTNTTELEPEFLERTVEIDEIKKDLAEKNYEKDPEKLAKLEEGAMILMSGGMPTKASAFTVGALKNLFPDKDHNWLIEKSQMIYN